MGGSVPHTGLEGGKSLFYGNRSNCDKNVKFGTELYYTLLNKKDRDTLDVDLCVVAILDFKTAAMKKQIRPYLRY